ncbi:MAG TPA: hypothetical protein VNU26_08150 [Mycobacteriales bacterium]|nr:hypothetical protein [Mycobacteriales bacterium]
MTGSPPSCPTADVVDLASLRRRKAGALSQAATSPVRVITPEFLAALNCRDVQPPARRRSHLRAV